MSKIFRPYDPGQMFLMPVSMRDWLSVDHLAYFISDVVDELDLSIIIKRYKDEDRGLSTISSGDDGKGATLCLLYRCTRG
jgi:hypothetical protein